VANRWSPVKDARHYTGSIYFLADLETPFTGLVTIDTSIFDSVRARPGRLSALSVSHSKSLLYGAFVWARRALNIPNDGFRPGQIRESISAVLEDEQVRSLAHADPSGGGSRLRQMA
jgi:hypothetical protein